MIQDYFEKEIKKDNKIIDYKRINFENVSHMFGRPESIKFQDSNKIAKLFELHIFMKKTPLDRCVNLHEEEAIEFIEMYREWYKEIHISNFNSDK